MPTDPVSLLRRFCDAYDALHATDGAITPLDASGTYTAGQWLGNRMAGLADEVREHLADHDALGLDRQVRVGLLDESGRLVREYAPEAVHEVHLKCAICGNRASGELSKLADEGWIPEFWTDDENGDGPACPGCLQHRIMRDEEDGEFILKPRSEWTR